MPSIYLSASLNVDPDRRPGLEAALPELLAASIRHRGGTLYADQGELRWRRPIAMLSIDEHALSFDRMYLTLPPSNVIAASRIRTTSHDLPQYPGTDSAITQSDTIDMQPLRARLPGSADSRCTASQQMSLSLDERIFASPNDPLRTDAETCFFRVSALGDGGAFSLAGSSITLGTATARTDDGGEVDFALTCKTNITAHAGSTVFQAIDRYLCGDYSAYEKTSDAQNVEVPGEGPYAPACVCPRRPIFASGR
jgi:hypothetical protein